MDNVTIIEHYDKLLEQLDSLKELLVSLEPASAEVALLPPTLKSEGVTPPDTITPTMYTGRDAIELAVATYLDLYTSPGVSQKHTRRTPGLIWYDTDKVTAARDIARHVEAINFEKLSIREYVVGNFKTADERYEILKQSCPGVMTLHLYRVIRCYDQTNLKSVRLTWAQQDSIKRPDKVALLNQLNEVLEYTACPDYGGVITDLISQIDMTEPDKLRVRRLVLPQPVANIVDENGKRSMVTAPMPIIILQADTPELKGIGDFNLEQARQRKKRADRLERTLLGTYQGVLIERIEG